MIVLSLRRTRRQQLLHRIDPGDIDSGWAWILVSLPLWLPLGRDDVRILHRRPMPGTPSPRDSMAGDRSGPLWQNGAALAEQSPTAATALGSRTGGSDQVHPSPAARRGMATW